MINGIVWYQTVIFICQYSFLIIFDPQKLNLECHQRFSTPKKDGAKRLTTFCYLVFFSFTHSSIIYCIAYFVLFFLLCNEKLIVYVLYGSFFFLFYRLKASIYSQSHPSYAFPSCVAPPSSRCCMFKINFSLC